MKWAKNEPPLHKKHFVDKLAQLAGRFVELIILMIITKQALIYTQEDVFTQQSNPTWME